MGYCIEHDCKNIDVWYDCEECLKESDEYCKMNNYTRSVSPNRMLVSNDEGTDNG